MEAEKEKHILANDSEVGDWLLIEFLRRLPQKSLLKFKSVSKRWLSLISDPSMPRLYLPRPDAPTYTLLCRHMELPDPLLDPNIIIKTHPDLESINIRLGFVPKKPWNLQFLAAHNGYLLSRDLSSKNIRPGRYYVSNTNPLTARWVALPDPPRYYSATGFIVRSDSTYNVVMFHCIVDQTMKLDLLDSRSGQWRSLMATMSHPVKNSYVSSNSGVLYRGALHWIIYSEGYEKIVAFDPAMHESEGDDYRCRVLDSAPRGGDDYGINRIFGLSGGELRCAEYTSISGSFFQHLWLLKDYDSAEWCLEHKIVSSDLSASLSLAKGGHHPFSHRLLVFNPIDEDIIYFSLISSGVDGRDEWLVSYNISTRTSKLLCSHATLHLRSTPARRNSSELLVEPEISVLPFVLPSYPTQ